MKSEKQKIIDNVLKDTDNIQKMSQTQLSIKCLQWIKKQGYNIKVTLEPLDTNVEFKAIVTTKDGISKTFSSSNWRCVIDSTLYVIEDIEVDDLFDRNSRYFANSN